MKPPASCPLVTPPGRRHAGLTVPGLRTTGKQLTHIDQGEAVVSIIGEVLTLEEILAFLQGLDTPEVAHRLWSR